MHGKRALVEAFQWILSEEDDRVLARIRVPNALSSRDVDVSLERLDVNGDERSCALRLEVGSSIYLSAPLPPSVDFDASLAAKFSKLTHELSVSVTPSPTPLRVLDASATQSELRNSEDKAQSRTRGAREASTAPTDLLADPSELYAAIELPAPETPTKVATGGTAPETNSADGASPDLPEGASQPAAQHAGCAQPTSVAQIVRASSSVRHERRPRMTSEQPCAQADDGTGPHQQLHALMRTWGPRIGIPEARLEEFEEMAAQEFSEYGQLVRDQAEADAAGKESSRGADLIDMLGSLTKKFVTRVDALPVDLLRIFEEEAGYEFPPDVAAGLRRIVLGAAESSSARGQCNASSSARDASPFLVGGTALVLWEDPDHLGDTLASDPTGTTPWACSLALITYLEHLQATASGHGSVRGKHVAELGAGIGAIGIALQRLGAASVTLAEREPTTLDLLRLNQMSERERLRGLDSCASLVPSVVQYDWRWSANKYFGRQEFDLVLAADVVYAKSEHIAELARALADLVSSPRTVGVVALERRADAEEARATFHHACEELMDVEDINIGGLVPESLESRIQLIQLKQIRTCP
ncbi:hypothetical protein CYMTET_17546 [Cymbomonas tetramitiformis]|uniref:Uncharacterized protein n=1 Tax=Cymbomonas tetramitiformis TaxID=36881 RepID=A0AAE0L6V9_9CHLO|nr:hypothetical protein CYMTET_17546 [Cymbomonas tetramitiformis]